MKFTKREAHQAKLECLKMAVATIHQTAGKDVPRGDSVLGLAQKFYAWVSEPDASEE